MAKRRPDKDCWEIRVCIDRDTYKAINEYQSNVKMSDGLKPYFKSEAASDLFMELVKSNRDKALR